MDPRLYKAATLGDIDDIKQEIAEHNLKFFLQVTVPRKSTALHLAAEFGHKKFVKAILIDPQCRLLLQQSNLMNDTPLHIAARAGHTDIVEFLINRTEELHKDVESGEVKAAEKLFTMINMKEDTVLHDAVRNRHLEIMKLLIKANPGLSTFVNNAKESPLYLAAEAGLTEIVDEILQTSSSAATCGPSGWNALHTAIVNRHRDVTEILLDKKPELIKGADTRGWTPLHHAAKCGYSGTVKQLLESDRSVAYFADTDGDSALHLAAAEGHVDVIKELIRSCPDSILLLNKKEQNALHVAVWKEQADVVRYLSSLELGSLINETDIDGNTPLHIASSKGERQMVKIILQHNRLNKVALNKDNFTALDVVESRNKMGTSLIKLLIRMKLKSVGVIRGPKRPGKTKDGEGGDQTDISDIISKRSETHLLVATLIATVTFAAGFTLPGGYKSEGPDQGNATLATKAAFRVFLTSDAIAFCLSVAAIFLHFVTSLLPAETTVSIKSVGVAAQLTLHAIMGMVIAFTSGMYVVLAHTPRLAIAACVLPSTIFWVVYISGSTMVFNFILAYWIRLGSFPGYVSLARYILKKSSFRHPIISLGVSTGNSQN